MIEIPLTRGYVATVDDEDAGLALFRWHALVKRGRRTTYAQRWIRLPDGSRALIKLHRAVLGITDPAVRIDHANRNGLDCRRHNLRIATASQNTANCGPLATNTSGYKGVRWHVRDRRWCAQVWVNGRPRHLGNFLSAEAAARAYDDAARKAFGRFAWLNFPADGERAA